jgi:hypothetical protein
VTYVLPSIRITLELDGPSVEVTEIIAEPIHALGVARAAAWAGAKGESAQLTALRELYELFAAEAQPTWDIADHRGPVPATSAGMLRLPIPLGLSIVSGWLDTITPKTTAVDELTPPGPLRDQLNRRLKAA